MAGVPNSMLMTADDDHCHHYSNSSNKHETRLTGFLIQPSVQRLDSACSCTSNCFQEPMETSSSPGPACCKLKCLTSSSPEAETCSLYCVTRH